MKMEETMEYKRRRRILAKFRFKCLVQKVMLNRYWLKELEDVEFGNNVRRNIALIFRPKKPIDHVTIREIKIINTPHEDRTNKQKRYIAVALQRIKGLALFSPIIRARLSRVVSFQYFESNRIILKEGHHASAMYIILEGEVSVSQLKWDLMEQGYKDTIIGTLSAGDLFGEIGLLYGNKRLTTITTTLHCQLLVLYQVNFDEILREILEKKWSQIRDCVTRFEYFNEWTPQQVVECCSLAKIKQYERHKIIYEGDKTVDGDYTYFVLNGQCLILQCLKMKVRRTNKSKCYKLLDPNLNEQEADSNETNNNFEIRFVEVGTFSYGSIFGLGEQMHDRSIIANTTVQCLLIPREWLLRKPQNTGNIWQRLKIFLEKSIPSREKLLKDFVATNKWNHFKRQLMNEMFDLDRKVVTAMEEDIPICGRAER